MNIQLVSYQNFYDKHNDSGTIKNSACIVIQPDDGRSVDISEEWAKKVDVSLYNDNGKFVFQNYQATLVDVTFLTDKLDVPVYDKIIVTAKNRSIGSALVLFLTQLQQERVILEVDSLGIPTPCQKTYDHLVYVFDTLAKHRKLKKYLERVNA